MRSSRPKHLHELLGRRLVDWAIAAAQRASARSAGRRYARRARCRSSRARCRTACELAVQETAARDRRRRRRRRGRRWRASRATCSCSPATRRSSPPRELRRLLEVHRERGRRGDGPLVRAGPSRAPTAASSATRTGALARDRRGARRDARAARDPRGQLRRSTSFDADALWEGLEPARRRQRAGRALPHRRGPPPGRRRRPRRRAPCAGSPCWRRREHQGRSRRCRGAAPRSDRLRRT